MNILDDLNKDVKDDFQEELVESKQDIPTPTQKNPESEFLFEEQMYFIHIISLLYSYQILKKKSLEKEFKALIPDLNEEQVKTIENFRDLIDTGGKFNDKLYEFNEALFNKDEARIQRYKTHKVIYLFMGLSLNNFFLGDDECFGTRNEQNGETCKKSRKRNNPRRGETE